MRMHARLTAAQLAPDGAGKAATLEKACDAIADAARAGSQLIAFPEVYLTGYPFWSLHIDPQTARSFKAGFLAGAVAMDGPEIAAISRAAMQAGIHVVMGLTEREFGTAYNTTAFFSPERGLIGKRRKLMPTHHERMVWGMGDGRDVKVFDTSLGRIGGLICYEHSNALYRYAMQAQHERIHIAQWPGGIGGIEDMIDAAVRHYAFEGQCVVVNATAINTPDMIAALGNGGSTNLLAPGGGQSGILDCRGRWLAKAGPDREELVHADVDFAAIEAAKMFVDSAGHYARPDVLRLVVNRQARESLTEEGNGERALPMQGVPEPAGAPALPSVEGRRPHFSLTRQCGRIIHVSGQLPFDQYGRINGRNIAEQTHQCLANVASALAIHGLGLEAVIKTTVWLTDIENFGAFNRAYAAAFEGMTAPARSTVRADLMVEGALVEIEAIAEGPEGNLQ